jgi:hypothetical protein
MKMRILMLMLFLMLPFQAFCQSIFPDSNAIWNVDIVGSPRYINYGIIGDTVIHDTAYAKLYMLFDTTLSINNVKEYMGGIRQENKKVLFRPAYWSRPDILLYDFSAKIGDTIRHNGSVQIFDNSYFTHEFNYIDHYDIIQDIGYESGNAIYSLVPVRPVFDTWYSGFGSINGIFGPITDYPLIGTTYKLNCVKVNDTVIFNSDNSCQYCFCGASTGNTGSVRKSNKIVIKQDQDNGSLQIINVSSIAPFSVEIIDVAGRHICSKMGTTNSMEIGGLKAGVYVLKIVLENEWINKKIIVKAN